MPLPPEKVLERAKASGFDAELSVAATFRERGWRASSNVYYIDDDEKISRELDILAYKPFYHTEDKPEVYCWLYLCTEIKRTDDPFIFFSDDAQSTDFGTGYGLLHTKHRVDVNILPFDNIQSLLPVAGYKRLARSYIAFKDGKSQQVKGGVISAFKGAIYHAGKEPSRYSDQSRDITFFIPLLVIDGPLWEVYHDDEVGSLVAKQVESVIYFQNYLSPNYDERTVRVAVVTTAFLPEFLNRSER